MQKSLNKHDNNNSHGNQSSLGSKVMAVAIRSYIEDIVKSHVGQITPRMRKALEFYSFIGKQLFDNGTIEYDAKTGQHICGILDVLSDGLSKYAEKAKRTSAPSVLTVMLDWTSNSIENLAQQIRNNLQNKTNVQLIISMPETLEFLFHKITPDTLN